MGLTCELVRMIFCAVWKMSAEHFAHTSILGEFENGCIAAIPSVCPLLQAGGVR